MKKLYLLLAVAFMTVTAQAQLIVDSLGNVGIKHSPDTSYSARIVSTSNSKGTLHVYREPSANFVPSYPWSMSIYTRAVHNCDTYSYGIRAQANSNSNTGIGVGRCFGVFGQAYGATNGYNYGLYGVVVNQNGAGVYGTTVYDFGQPLDKKYAGYFRGPVKVQGDVTVTGNINGIVLSAPTLPMGSSTTNVTRNLASSQLSEQLVTLDVGTFYHELPVKRSTSTVDTAEVEVPLTAMEEQILSKQHYGLDAEQLEEVFPDLVYENEDGTKRINYVEMVPVLVQAIKELSAKVEALENGKAVKRSKKATGINATESVQVLFLGQNKPNPFSTATDIEVSVPETVQTAFLYIYDLQGKKMQQVDITIRGKQTLSVNAANLAEGMYLYSLIADGKVVETRRMIVEK